MALHYYHKNRIGYYTYQFNGRSYKVWLCKANAVCAMIRYYREMQEGKRVDMVQLMGFFADLEHARRCINTGYFKNCSGFTFIAKEMDDRMWKVVKMMTKNGIKVTIK